MRAFFAAILIALLSTNCAKQKKISIPASVKRGTTQRGIASWYGDPYNGRRAANGEVYDMNQLTAAHRTWPFDTLVRVENLSNHRAVDVRITDRGPFVKKRVIDLSRAAAQQIEMIGPGTAPVKLRVIATGVHATPAPPKPSAAPPPEKHFAVQVGAFVSREVAERLRQQMEMQYGAARIIALQQADRTLWRVLVGDARSQENIAELAARVRSNIPQTFIVTFEEELQAK